MIVVAIIAILAAVAAPKFGQQLAKAKDAKGLSIVGNWRSASNIYYADNSYYAATTGAFTDDTLLPKYVDEATKTKTTDKSNNTAKVVVGINTTDTANHKISFTYGGSTSDGAIVISGGDDAKGTSWSAY